MKLHYINYRFIFYLINYCYHRRKFLGHFGLIFAFFSRCTCGHCLVMTRGRESVCCQETAVIREQASHLNCISLHEGFFAVCLNRHVIETVIYQYIDEEERGYIDDRPPFE
eukprot:Seg4802.3 transcript_id=Seg4802.3/GoldUCD/mRNA.D3Y31 product="hypothetical protein" pseudo=true protein_id=Seg4802.3/GoldUCD/D3Y31